MSKNSVSSDESVVTLDKETADAVAYYLFSHFLEGLHQSDNDDIPFDSIKQRAKRLSELCVLLNNRGYSDYMKRKVGDLVMPSNSDKGSDD